MQHNPITFLIELAELKNKLNYLLKENSAELIWEKKKSIKKTSLLGKRTFPLDSLHEVTNANNP